MLFDIIIQAIGFIAIGVNILAVQFNKHSKIMLFKSLGSLLFVIQYFFLKAYPGMVMDSIGIFRNYIFTDRVNKHKSNLIPIIIFSIIIVGAGIATIILSWKKTMDNLMFWSNNYNIIFFITIFLSILAITAKFLTTIGYGFENPHKIRMINLPSSICWVIYNAISLSIAGAISDFLVIISIIIAEYRFKQEKKLT